MRASRRRAGYRLGLVITATAVALGLGLLAACRPPAPPPRHLLLVTLDTFRADRAGAYGHAGGLTPHLDRLARDGVRFDAAWTTVPLTLPAHATMFTGLLPVAHGLRQNGNGSLPEATETLASRLAGEGFDTAAFVSAFVLNRRFGLARGFSTYDDEIAQRPGRPSGMEAQRPGRDTVDRALSWLDARDGSERPFFLWVHLFDAHAPYEPPEPYRSSIAEPYDGEIAETDAQLGRLLDWLAAHDLAAQTLVVVAGDHGEALGEHGERSHGLLLYEPTLSVPFVLAGPRLSAGWVVGTPVSLVDLAPTVLGLLDRPPLGVSGPRSGRDLAPQLRRGAQPAAADLYAETEYPRLLGWAGIAALRRGSRKLIAAPEPELFDLVADPGETTNLIAGDPEEAALTATVAELRRDAADLATAPIDAESARALAALGYVSAPEPAPATDQGPDPKRMAPLFTRLELAREAMDAGRLEAAAAELARLLEADPKNPVFRGTRAAALSRLGEKGLAVDELRRSLVGGPGDLQTLYDLAVALREAGHRDDAAVAFRELLRRDPLHAEGWNAQGILELESGELDAAERSFARAASLDVGNANARSNRGNALRALRRPVEAEAELRRAIALAPDWADPANGLGALLVELGRTAEALGLFERALALDPERHEARLNRAIALDTLGRKSEAATAYRDFLSAVGEAPGYAVQRRAAESLLARLAPL